MIESIQGIKSVSQEYLLILIFFQSVIHPSMLKLYNHEVLKPKYSKIIKNYLNCLWKLATDRKIIK
jgi:hypothetical protein